MLQKARDQLLPDVPLGLYADFTSPVFPWFDANLTSFYFRNLPVFVPSFIREALKSQIHVKEVQLQKEKEIMLARCDTN